MYICTYFMYICIFYVFMYIFLCIYLYMCTYNYAMVICNALTTFAPAALLLCYTSLTD